MGQIPLLRRIVQALSELPVRAVVTTGPAIEPFDAPANNVRVVKLASHDALLRSASLVITHGGHGTVIRSLAHGVPLLVLPMGRDQGDNAVRVRAIGAGISISHRSGVRSIREATRRALADRTLRSAAMRAKERITVRTGDPVIEELEALRARTL